MNRVEGLERRINGLEELLTLAIRFGESDLCRVIRERIREVEGELKHLIVKQAKIQILIQKS